MFHLLSLYSIPTLNLLKLDTNFSKYVTEIKLCCTDKMEFYSKLDFREKNQSIDQTLTNFDRHFSVLRTLELAFLELSIHPEAVRDQIYAL